MPISQLVDSSVILFRMGTTHRKAISRTLKILNENNADPVGIVANGLPPMKKSSGYYGYYGNYYYGNTPIVITVVDLIMVRKRTKKIRSHLFLIVLINFAFTKQNAIHRPQISTSENKRDIEDRIQKVLDHGQYILGPEIEEMEEMLANYVGVKYCIGASSGTDTLLLP